MQAKVEDKVLEILIHASDYYRTEFPLPEIRFTLRGRSAGKLRYNYRTMGGEVEPDSFVLFFHPKMLKKHGQAYINRTVYHEVAHLIVAHLFGAYVSPHGSKWKTTMDIIEAPDKSPRHQFDLSGVVRDFVWSCECRDHHVGTRKHNTMMKNPKRFLCGKCRGRLTFKGEV